MQVFIWFKAQVILEVVKDQLTLTELSRKFDVCPVIISKWEGEFHFRCFRSESQTRCYHSLAVAYSANPRGGELNLEWLKIMNKLLLNHPTRLQVIWTSNAFWIHLDRVRSGILLGKTSSPIGM